MDALIEKVAELRKQSAVPPRSGSLFKVLAKLGLLGGAGFGLYKMTGPKAEPPRLTPGPTAPGGMPFPEKQNKSQIWDWWKKQTPNTPPVSPDTSTLT